MKIAISSTGENIDSAIDENFGRCLYFIIVEIENNKIGKINVIKNESSYQTGGAGISATKLIAQENVEAVITGSVGPRAFDALNQFKIKVYTGKGIIKQALWDFISSKLKEIE